MMGRIDFAGLISGRDLAQYRKDAQSQIAPWLRPPPVNDDDATRAVHERAREAVARHRDEIEDLLVAIRGVAALNRQIEEIMENVWPQWAQGIVAPEAAARVGRLLARSRSARDELEEVAIKLSEGMDPSAARLFALPRQDGEGLHPPEAPAAPMQGAATAASGGRRPLATTAIVHINGFSKNGAHQSAQLKRLALFFDEIHYVLPDFWVIKDEVLDDPSRVVHEDNGDIRILAGLDPVRDIRPAIPLPFEQLADELQDTLSALVEHGIAKEYDAYPLKAGGRDHFFDRVKHRLAWDDANDPVFARLSGTTDADYHTGYGTATLALYGDSPPGPSSTPTGFKTVYFIFPPPALIDSIDITTVLYVAQSTSSFPVFLGPQHRAEVAHRYQRYQAGLHVLEEQAPGSVSPADFRARFGEVAFALATGVASSELLAAKSVEDIVRYRVAMDDARRRFVSEHLIRNPVERCGIAAGGPPPPTAGRGDADSPEAKRSIRSSYNGGNRPGPGQPVGTADAGRARAVRAGAAGV